MVAFGSGGLICKGIVGLIWTKMDGLFVLMGFAGVFFGLKKKVLFLGMGNLSLWI